MSSSHTATLLVELLTQELPPKALARLSDAFGDGLAQRLAARDLIDGEPRHEKYATPRRLAVLVRHVRAVAPDRQRREKVLPVSVALDAQGRPAPPLAKKLAALGFAHLSLDALERTGEGRNEAFFLNYTAPGATLADGLQAALDETLAALPIPKLMTYQRPDGESVRFVRPAHRLIALLDDQVVPVGALGLKAGRATFGHRFLSSGPIAVPRARDYAALLFERGHVRASFAERRESIRAQLLEQARDDRVLMPESLLHEVTALVEWPVVYTCSFDAGFLQLPQECLILTMQTNQKYFALTDVHGRLRSRFLVVSNLSTDTPEQIIKGNERVVRPRLADARFFFEQDRKRTLESRVPQLANVVYHNQLGSQLQRTERVAALAGAIAPLICADAARARRAALLAKADLLTDMVGEFPELQGTMGSYYARHDGEPEDVALACSEHYRPRFAGDALPETATGTVLALADKLETLTGIWGIGLQPTGEKDPFALRRHALGVLRILLEKALPLDLHELLRLAHAQFGAWPQLADSSAALGAFLMERLRGLLREQGYASRQIEAVLGLNPTRLDDLTARLTAVKEFAALTEADALATANKRIGNILKKSAGAGVVSGAMTVEPACLVELAEQTLFARLRQVAPEVQAQLANRDYTHALTALAALRDPVDAFFDTVMVNIDDPALRANRLALLGELHAQMNCVADISKLAV